MDFSDIAAYKDKMVPGFIKKILTNPVFKGFLSKIPSLPNIFSNDNPNGVLHKLKSIKTVYDFQKVMAFLLDENIKATSDGLTYVGMDNIPRDKGVVLMSSHRSIGLDAAYTNFCFFQENRPTVYNGAGDNLMKTSWLEHLIRINKGFVVKRDVSDIDMKLQEISKLSSYINNLLLEKKSVWIAHRGGRTKDGIDATDSVVLAMLYKESGAQSWAEWSEDVAIVPLSISWEIAPCDLVLADELSQENYKKPLHRDFADIMLEIASPKGRINMSFGKPIQAAKRKDLVAGIDHAIHTNYKLWDVNWLAYAMQQDVSAPDREYIMAHIDIDRAYRVLDRGLDLTPEQQGIFNKVYANPVRSALSYVDDLKEILH